MRRTRLSIKPKSLTPFIRSAMLACLFLSAQLAGLDHIWSADHSNHAKCNICIANQNLQSGALDTGSYASPQGIKPIAVVAGVLCTPTITELRTRPPTRAPPTTFLANT